MTKIGPGCDFPPLQVAADEKIFVLTGAGISAESGVKTFRDANGLWEEHRVEDVATPEAFERDPRLVWRFYAERRKQLAEVRPNPAHLALAALPQVFLCTQNVDPLHELAGSKQVLHMHGEIAKTRCSSCDREPFEDADGLYFDALPRCHCGGLLRPHVVWFGEIPLGMREIGEALDDCDLFVTVGSSGAVYPAAGFVSHLRNVKNRRGRFARCIYVGLERPDNAHSFDECRLGKAGQLLPGLFQIG
ncbi:MAG TPA: NAD-dependent deacylase [Myxococcales bacterium]|nr:NAD-dependent deacylase [Myxococcales bacterium]